MSSCVCQACGVASFETQLEEVEEAGVFGEGVGWKSPLVKNFGTSGFASAGDVLKDDPVMWSNKSCNFEEATESSLFVF